MNLFEKKNNFIQTGISILVLFFTYIGYGQDNDKPADTVGYNRGKIVLKNPPSIEESYTYDPAIDKYIYTSTVSGYNVNYPKILTPKEYEDLMMRESMRKYFKQKLAAIDGKKEGTEEAKKDLLPRYYVNSGFFESIFGSNTIDIKPTGSVEMDLGFRYTKQDNPSFSPRNRSTTTFDFNQRISMSLMGKVGTRLGVNVNYDTQSTFAFQNLIKLEYTPEEDNILRKLEVGNVSMPLSSSLIKGSQSLFGVKTELQFGKTTVTGVFSEQKSQTKSIIAQGGGTIQEFNMFALDYDFGRHFFLSQYFRNKYDASLKNYPVIDSRVQVTRVEVWVTNRQNKISTTENNLRNIIALQDLGESQLSNHNPNEIVNIYPLPADFFIDQGPGDDPTDNKNNKYDPALIATGTGYLKPEIREIVTTNSSAFNVPAGTVIAEGQDYSKLESARKLTPNEFTFHPQLGYISLQQRLANDEVLAVAYQYTMGDKVYQVGEFGNDGVLSTEVTPGDDPENPTVSTQSLVLKMLKSSITNIQNSNTGFTAPVWNLMMKNIYQIALGGQLEREDFKFNILYTDPSPLNYITAAGTTPLPASVEQTPLLRVFNLDKLNFTNDPQEGGDGFFDFIPGMTVDTQNGRIIFTTVEPFGEYLFNKLKDNTTLESYNDPTTYNSNQAKYVYREMYRSTSAGALQNIDKNKFQLRGKYKSTSGDGISIGAFNVPKGSVIVTAGGRRLVEGVDYSVNYQRGTVQILDPSLQNSNVPIDISLENNSVFGQQTRRFMGLNVEHKISKDFLVGGTFLRMSERPFTQKSNYGQESVNNSIFGFNTNCSSEIPLFTRLVNKLPNVSTDVPSNISFRGEVAYLRPDSPDADKFQGEATIYIDDFEGSQTTIDVKAPLAWVMSSVPLWKSGLPYNNFGLIDGQEPPFSLADGYKRAKLAWRTIDPIFYTNQRPSGISDVDMAMDAVRRVYIKELYPNTDIAAGQTTVVNTFDLTYYPEERGPYNFNPQSVGNALPNPTDNFGGIMRSITSTNFEQGNVEYIQFWMLDPYFNNQVPAENTGKIFFNLGQISEDILRDGRKQYENGLPEAGSAQKTTKTIWGGVPSSQSLIYAFDTNNSNRSVQDVGFDGLNDAEEAAFFPAQFAAMADPAYDNYKYFLEAEGSVLERYKNYNGVENNSPVDVSNTKRGNVAVPDVEDINRDNTMNTINAYFQYNIDLKPTMVVGENYVTDIKESVVTNPAGGADLKSRWIQFKVPIDQGASQVKFGGIEDFRSIQFMRIFLTGFSKEITIRFGALDLVRGDWRRYLNSLEPNNDNPDDDDTVFDVLAVNVLENSARVPIKYMMPPGVQREQLYNNNTIINQNEQALALRASKAGLQPGDSRAVFKNVNIDMRQFKKLKMFFHAEALEDDMSPGRLQDNEMAGFVRLGNDLNQNYYQIERPLKVTQWNDASTPEKIWPEENNIDLQLVLLTKLKMMAMQRPDEVAPDGTYTKYDYEIDGNIPVGKSNTKLTIKGNPNFGLVRTMMAGIKNNTLDGKDPDGGRLTARNIRGEVWFNELRIAGMDNNGGMAAVASLDTNMADFVTLSATGRMSTVGFGALEDGPNQRSRNDAKQYSIVSNLNLGKLLPKKWGINLPFNYGVGEEIITPEFDPQNPDIRLNDLLSITADADEKANIKNRAIDYTKTNSINFIGVRKEKAPEKKPHIYDVENLTLSYSYNQIQKHDYETQSYLDQKQKTSLDYVYNFQPKPVEPLKTVKFMKGSDYWKLLNDFNFNYMPSDINFSTNLLRQYNRQEYRQVDVQGIGLEPLYRRNFLFNYQYGFNFNVTKSLKLNYIASSSNIVRSYLDDNGMPIANQDIWADYWNTGTPNVHNRQIALNYDIPIYKIPLLSFVKSTYTYTGDYNWQRSSTAMSSFTTTTDQGEEIMYNLGNTIQNNGSHKLNATMNMDLFYKYVGLTKGKKAKPLPKPAPPKPGEKVKPAPVAALPKSNPVVDGLIGVLTCVKNIQGNYTNSAGNVLPGYVPGVGFFGSSLPSLPYVFGLHDDVRDEAAKNGWLTTYPDFNQNYTEVKAETLNLTANIDLFPEFKIDLVANRSLMESFSEQYDVTDGIYNSRSPYNFGNFSITTMMFSTAFMASNEVTSEAFDNFRDNRIVVANRLAANRASIDGTYNPNDLDADGFPSGYGKNSQQVLLPAFLSAYTGQDATNVSLKAIRSTPIPNWTIKYSGLMRYNFFKDTFKRFSVHHSYRSVYTINSLRSNFEYDKDPGGRDKSNNFFSEILISNINLVEQFNPLVKFDMEMKNSVKFLAEIKKDRALSMSFDNNLLTEVKGLEYVFGMGYRIKDVTFVSSLSDNPNGIIRSDINIKGDFSMRNTQTIIRYLDYNNNKLGGGQNMWSFKLTADYSFSRNLTAIFYYDHAFSKAVISTSFPITNVRGGFTIRYNFGN